MKIMNVEQPVCEQTRLSEYFSWTAVAVAVIVAIGLAFLGHLLLISIGLWNFEPNQDTLFMLTFMGVILFAFIIIFITFTSGWVAGYLASLAIALPSTSRGILHGFLAWSLAILLSFTLLSPLFKPMNLYLAATATQSSEQTTLNIYRNPDLATANINLLGKSTLAIFTLALIGSLSSSIGGVCGIRYGKNKDRLLK